VPDQLLFVKFRANSYMDRNRLYLALSIGWLVLMVIVICTVAALVALR